MAVAFSILLSHFVRSPFAASFVPKRTSTQALQSILSSPLFESRPRSMNYKRAKLNDTVSEKVIGTHSGTFQADEAMGVWMLRQVPEYRNSKVVRSRDLKILDTLDIVIDVSGVYDHSKKRYDHHQRDYDERFDAGKEGVDGRCTKLSASGLVYRHYGKKIITGFYPTLSDKNLDLVYNKVYDTLLEALDAIDTGVEVAPKGVELLYKDSTGLSSRVARCNPRWNELESDGSPPNMDERFEVASKICGDDFMSVLTKIVESDLPARQFVEKAILERTETDPSGEIIKLSSGGLPWKNYVYEFEKILSVEPLIKFVLYTDQAGMWRVQAVTVEGKAFENRLGLPEVRRFNLLE
jgi:uncharacterized UPF0160 family protein